MDKEYLTELDLKATASELIYGAIENISATDVAEKSEQALTDEEIDMVLDVIRDTWVTCEWEPDLG